eukprot:CAMPEP_0114651400 /NCGR_PEP_ID=MMETSP0191-20121206/8304_1 /TAXON_ID=126664 /ORGANISM="Sorites sp." /LENGTH=201 /DNA_ID=CAMNT_0001865573 /DNA_START=113 /DNA_END=718 /DNA_ORIENTATION=-
MDEWMLSDAVHCAPLSHSVESQGLGTWASQAPNLTAFMTQPVEAQLLALRLQPTAFLAVMPTATVKEEVTLAAIHILHLRHQGNWWLAGQVSELTIPVPRADWNEEQIRPGEPHEEFALILGNKDSCWTVVSIQIQDPSASRVPLRVEARNVKPTPSLLGEGFLATRNHCSGCLTYARPGSLRSTLQQGHLPTATNQRGST